jgi:hypothetical protein
VVEDPWILRRANSGEPKASRLGLDADDPPQRELASEAGFSTQTVFVGLRICHSVGSTDLGMPARWVGQGILGPGCPQPDGYRQDHAKGKRTKHDILVERLERKFLQVLASLGSYIPRYETKERMVEPASFTSFSLSSDALESEA